MNRETSPKQARSRATAGRLLSAAIRVIDEFGLEGATVPRIAAAAALSPASVYRRYADKDALLRAALLHTVERSNDANRRMLRKQLLRKSLKSTAARVIKMLFEQYQSHPLLMQALRRYMDATTDPAFVADARAVMTANVDEAVAVLMHHRDEIKRPDPEHALRFAVLSAACCIESRALHANSLWHALPEFTEESLARDLTASFVAYLRSS